MKNLVLALALIVAACIPVFTSSSTPTATYAGTGIYINGQELTAAQQAELEQLLGETVPRGRYALDAQYNFGSEGQAPAINLATYVERKQAKEPFSMYSTDASGQGSSLVSDGDCMIMSTPSGSLSSGC